MGNIKQIVTSFLASLLIVLSPGMVLAQAMVEDTQPQATTPTTTPKPEDGTATNEDAAKKEAELKKRIEENKAKLKTKLDEATKKRLIAKCKPAQAIVKGAEKNATAVTENRSKSYAKISEKVDALIARLKTAGVSTTNLETVQATAKQKAEVLAVSMKTYDQMLADLQAMDCAADPTAFAATLETARKQRATVKEQAKDLRSYISVSLKEAINKAKAELEAKQADNSTESESPSDDTSSNGEAQ